MYPFIRAIAFSALICSFLQAKESLSVLVYNAHLFDLGGHLSGWSDCDDGYVEGFAQFWAGLFTDERLMLKDSLRAENIIEGILSLEEGGPDIIILTEVWSEPLANRLIAEFEHDSFRPKSSNWLMLHSGMLLLSRHPILHGSQYFKPFADLNGADSSTSKGIGRVTILDPVHGPTGVIFAHSQAHYADDDDETILANAQEVIATAMDYKNVYPWHHLIVAGDLNLASHHENYQQLQSGFDELGLKDAYLEYNNRVGVAQCPGYTYDSQTNRMHAQFKLSGNFENKQERVDYIFFEAGRHSNVTHMPSPLQTRTLFRWQDQNGEKLDLSDHYPLFAIFEKTSEELG